MGQMVDAEGIEPSTGDSIMAIRTDQSPPNTLAAFRMHQQDPITFNNALKVTWDYGVTSEASFTGNSRIAWCIWYYTE